MPQQQGPDDTDVGEPGCKAHPPESSPGKGHPAASAVQHGQRHDRCDHGGHPEHHHAELERRRRRDEAGVDVDARRQPGLRRHLQVGEHPGDLGLLVRGDDPRGAGNPDEVGADFAGVGPDVQRAARSRLHGRPWRHGRDRVTDRHHHDIGGGADEQAVTTGVDACRRNRRHHEAARVGQRGDGLAGDRDVEGLRCAGHQRCGDVGDQPVRAGCLRPRNGGGGLFDRLQRNQPAQQQPRDTGDDGDEACEPVGPLLFIAWHEGRW